MAESTNPRNYDEDLVRHDAANARLMDGLLALADHIGADARAVVEQALADGELTWRHDRQCTSAACDGACRR